MAQSAVLITNIRTATLSDAALIATLTRACWVGKPVNSSGHHESTERVEQGLREGAAMLLYQEEKPVGSVRWYPVLGALGEANDMVIAWEIGRLGILPEYRGRGLSHVLMDEITRLAIAHGIKELRLAVRTDEPELLAYYLRQGFVEDPSIVYSHANPKSPPPITMRKRLE
jgi:ribosomal protein S18 acetylase RimI-like enzyme